LEARKRATEDQTREYARKMMSFDLFRLKALKNRMIKNIGCLFVILLGIVFSSIFIFGLKQVKRIITEW
jgi:hypothetical protein